MGRNHFQPKLRKKRVLSHADHTVYSVNAWAVRNVAKPDEEFGAFATTDEFPHLIPRKEIWISEKVAPREGIFFVANALTRLKRQAEGVSHDRAYDDALEVERHLREKINGVAFRDGKPHRHVPDAIYLEKYVAISDPKGAVTVWLVDGNLVRSFYKTDYVEGGHGYVYRWVPKPEIWIEDGVDRREISYIVSHEYLERRLMRDAGMEYDRAHEVCSRVEFDLRKGKPIGRLLEKRRRKLKKKDLTRLADEKLFRQVIRAYVKE